VTWNEYIERLGNALGTPDRTVPSAPRFRVMAVTADILRAGASVGVVRSLWRRSAGLTRTAMSNAQAVTQLYPSSAELKLLNRRVHYSADKATRVLGIHPSVPLDEGLRQSVAWCRVHGVV